MKIKKNNYENKHLERKYAPEIHGDYPEMAFSALVCYKDVVFCSKI